MGSTVIMWDFCLAHVLRRSVTLRRPPLPARSRMVPDFRGATYDPMATLCRPVPKCRVIGGPFYLLCFGLVGAAGFEPATTRTPSVCATRLRHAPTTSSIRTQAKVGATCPTDALV